MKKMLIVPLLICSMNAFAGPDYEAKSTVIVPHFVSIPNSPVTVSAEIYNEFTNNTNEPIWIMAYYNLMVEYCGGDPHQWKVKVNPHGVWRDHYKPMKQCRFPRGNFRIDAQGAIKAITVPFYTEEWKSSNINVQ